MLKCDEFTGLSEATEPGMSQAMQDVEYSINNT